VRSQPAATQARRGRSAAAAVTAPGRCPARAAPFAASEWLTFPPACLCFPLRFSCLFSPVAGEKMAHGSGCGVTCTDGERYEVTCSNGVVDPYSPCTGGVAVWVEHREPCPAPCGQPGVQRVWFECSSANVFECESGQQSEALHTQQHQPGADSTCTLALTRRIGCVQPATAAPRRCAWA
jgi:hypothetical protein